MFMFLLPELEGVEVVFWCDADYIGKLKNFDTLYARASALLQGKALAIENHPWWNRTYGDDNEMSHAIVRSNISTGLNVTIDFKEAREHMDRNGYRDDIGNFYCGRYLLNTSSQTLRLAFQAWWMMVQNYTFRDQISFPHIMQMYEIPYIRLSPERLLLLRKGD